jgi:hypothetical protein
MTFMDNRQMRIYRIVAIFNTFNYLHGELWGHWSTRLLPITGALILAYFPAQLLKQRLDLYNWVYWGLFALGFMDLTGLVSTQSWFDILLGSLWFMMYLAASPPDSGDKRQELATRLKKIFRSWSVGIPITTGAS